MSKQAYAQAITRPPMHKGKPVLDHMRLKKAENGGAIVEHHFESSGGTYHEPHAHVFGKNEGKKLMGHIAEHLGIKDSDGDND